MLLLVVGWWLPPSHHHGREPTSSFVDVEERIPVSFYGIDLWVQRDSNGRLPARPSDQPIT